MGECKYSYDILAAQISAKAEVQKLRRKEAMEACENLKNDLSAPLKRSVELACEKGASGQLAYYTANQRIWIHSTQGRFS